MADPVPLTETAIRLEMPAFNPNVQNWFLQLDAIFQARHVTSQQTKFAPVVEKLPVEVAAEVANILTSLPTDNPYETLKQTILHRTGFSEERKIRDRLTNVTIGGSKPSQLLRRMQSLLGDNNISATVFHQMWLDKLPSEMVRILAALSDEVDTPKLAIIADKVADTAPVRIPYMALCQTSINKYKNCHWNSKNCLYNFKIYKRNYMKVGAIILLDTNTMVHDRHLAIITDNAVITTNMLIAGITKILARARINADHHVQNGKVPLNKQSGNRVAVTQ